MDAYGREYWGGRDMQPLMEYAQWRDFNAVIKRAEASLALVQGESAAQKHFAQMRNMVPIGSGAQRSTQNYHLTRFGAYLVAMAGDDTKEAVARARVYFAVRTREAELTALTTEEIRITALARAREMVDYKVFRDMMAENATDYVPSSRESSIFFATMQNKLYLHLTGMTAAQIRNARELQTWEGREEGKPEPSPKSAARKVAKNYLTAKELSKLNRMVGRLCLTAEEVAEDGLALSLAQWDGLLDNELTMASRRMLAA
ncbi:RhuM family protein [Streptomyces sp. NPDC088732]|uniref:RhuM family protein n=1 Tax=Streptomyces sp. NPDC088732 TaxID=3365879 RepID=UPI003827A503